MSESKAVRRVVVFTASPFPSGLTAPSTVEHIEAIAEAFPDWEFIVVHERPARLRRSSLRVRLRRLTRRPLSSALSVVSGLAPLLRYVMKRTHGPVQLPGALQDIGLKNVSYYRCESLRSGAAIEFVTTLEPWLGVTIDAPILTRRMFALPRLGTVNLHKGLLTYHRGPHPNVSESAEAASETGVIVHWVDEGLNSGPLVFQLRQEIPPFSTPAGLDAELDLLGSTALIAALDRIEAGAVNIVPHPSIPSRIHRRPDCLAAPRTRRQKQGGSSRRRGLERHLRGWVKTFFFLVLLSTFIPLRNLVRSLRGRSHVTILLFHRVSDEYRDSITVGVGQFQHILRTLRRRCHVIDMPEFLSGRESPRRKPLVVITFDDGYADNYLAALLLRRAGLPCTFFVTTRVVGDETRALPHDLENLGHRVPVLSWDQIRQMSRRGFHIANHSANHANLNRVSTEQAAEEISQAIGDLRRELGADLPEFRWLAYPYGGADDISPEVRDLLPALGITHCFSAYGGTNGIRFDALDIRRQNIDCNFNPVRFLIALEGWVVRTRNRGSACDRRGDGPRAGRGPQGNRPADSEHIFK